MSDYVSSTAFPAPVGPETIQRLAGHGCFALHRVEWVRAYLATDGLRLLSTYWAVDAESVRFVLRHQGPDAARVWPARVCEATAAGADRTGDRRLVVEMSFDPPLQPERLEGMGTAAEAALGAVDLSLLRTISVAGGGRLICIVDGHDEAAVRRCLRSAKLDVSEVWRAREVPPTPPRLFDGLTPAYAATPSASVDSGERESQAECLDAVVIGAGVAGLYALYKLRGLGLSVRAYERAPDVGGVWYWNNYPGARIDSESYTYAFSFSDELVEEWQWGEAFSAQPEILRYLRHVADRFDLRRDIRFQTQVRSASFDEGTQRWRVETDRGEVVVARYLPIGRTSWSR